MVFAIKVHRDFPIQEQQLSVQKNTLQETHTTLR